MGDRLKLDREVHSGDIAIKIYRAYYDSTYRISKAILEPVVDAISDVTRENIGKAVQLGVRDALISTDFLSEVLFGKWKKKSDGISNPGRF